MPVHPRTGPRAGGPLPFRASSLYPQGLPSLEQLEADPTLFDRLSPQQQEQVLALMQGIPTPAAEQTRARELQALNFLQFDREILGNRPTEAALRWGYQHPLTPDQLDLVELIEGGQYVACTAGHGVGKTNLASRYILYFLLTRPDSKVITTASTWTQVEKQLWQEIATIYARAPEALPGELLTTELRVGPGWFALGLSTTDYSKFAGTHAPGGVLVWIDEATGVRPEIARAAEALVITPRDKLVAVGNPTNPTSWFMTACTRPGWAWKVMDCRDHPNVLHDDPEIVPGAVTRQWVETRVATYGEDSPIFKATVAGRWPSMAEDSVLSLEDLVRAQQLGEMRRRLGYLDPRPEVQAELDALEVLERRPVRPVVFSLDIAGPGGDLLTLGQVKRRHYSLRGWRQRNDYMASLNWVVQEIEEGEPAVLVLDDTGVGGVFSSRLRERQREEDAPAALKSCRIVPINFGSSSADPRFVKMKDWLWWNFREILHDQGEEFSLPSDREEFAMDPPLPQGHSLLDQLTKSIYMLEGTGLIRVFDKFSDYSERTRLLPTRSPDLAHAAILAAWGLKLLQEDQREAPARTPAEAQTAEFHQQMRERREAVARAYNRRGTGEEGDRLAQAREEAEEELEGRREGGSGGGWEMEFPQDDL